MVVLQIHLLLGVLQVAVLDIFLQPTHLNHLDIITMTVSISSAMELQKVAKTQVLFLHVQHLILLSMVIQEMDVQE